MKDKISVLLSEEEVDRRIRELGEAVSRDYAGKSVHLICVLKGGAFFACEPSRSAWILCLCPATEQVLPPAES